MSIAKVISGFQDGSDIAGILAARAAGIPTGGAMPKGYLTESGPKPEYAAMYGAYEMATASYPARTRRNVEESDVTLIFSLDGDGPRFGMGRGSRLTWDLCAELKRPVAVVRNSWTTLTPKAVAQTMDRMEYRVLNVAGGRESKSPGIGSWVEWWLGRMFQEMVGAMGRDAEGVARA